MTNKTKASSFFKLLASIYFKTKTDFGFLGFVGISP